MGLRLPKEDDVRDLVVAWLNLHGIPATRSDASRTFGPDGRPRRSKVVKDWPDVSAVLPDGRALLIEMKRKGTYPTPGQRAMINRLSKQHALCFVARSIEDVESALRKEGYL